MPPRTRLPRALRAGPFTSAEALSAGVSARTLQGPSVQRIFEDVYLAADLDASHHQRIVGALLVLPAPSIVGGVTALQLLGLDVGPRDPLRFWTTWPRQVRRPGLRVTRVATLPPRRGQLMDGAAVFRTAAEDLGLVDLVIAGDFLVRRGLSGVDEIRCAADPTGRGCVRARRAALLVRAGVRSPQETRVRLALTMAGLPEPDLNTPLYDGGEFLGTPDMTFRDWRVVVEYEGDQHRSDRRQWGYDIKRYERMAAAGWVVIRITGDHARRPRELVERVHAALVSRGYCGPRPTFSAEIFGSSAR